MIATGWSLDQHLNRLADCVAHAFRPFAVSLDLLPDRRNVVLRVGDRLYTEERPHSEDEFNAVLQDLLRQASEDLNVAGWETGSDGRWIDPETVDFLRTEPHPVAL